MKEQENDNTPYNKIIKKPLHLQNICSIIIKGDKFADNRLHMDCLPEVWEPAHDESEG